MMSVLPRDKLSQIPQDSDSEVVVLVECGSFNPVTVFHLLLLELARDVIEREEGMIVLGGLLSPVGDAYGKPGLASSKDRLKMCELATQSSTWITVCSLECNSEVFLPTWKVLMMVREDLCAYTNRTVHVKLVCGEDLVLSMSKWVPENVENLFQQASLLVMPRSSANSNGNLLDADIYKRNPEKIKLLDDSLAFNVSSSEIRYGHYTELPRRFLIIILYVLPQNRQTQE
mmetsp:Transcript_23261/g.33352  ORF Transcript_23261/g.33352 Transcript_23261/m.33352 type:complete len:230 (-) Transcript_23261:223-912(-)|eukprot:CAMPEP_0184752676 /NCGR_PEP_ID=MMETSP0315-20130426/43705_1 /TAXON_ID=101924 /ORGANISM="Rhodosorus marinus, Strain UTEX LB 2760" /LENGTH=229 /DNA_ID=CAMNT_0027232023 /DNA_START=143 /DNA_END=832 /DNA_ORIENTATION=-